MKKIVLASASPRREAILRQIGIDFEVAVPNINENIDYSLEPEEIARQLSEMKAEAVAAHLNDNTLIIAADTIVIKDGTVLGKPSDRDDAFRMLKRLQGGWHRVITGFTIIDKTGEHPKIVQHETTEVRMRELDDDEINAYIDSGEPFDKAGAYGAQGIGALLIKEIKGCYFNVVGLPAAKLGEALKTLGVNPLK